MAAIKDPNMQVIQEAAWFDSVIEKLCDPAYNRAGRQYYARREGWNGTNQLITAQYPEENSKITEPYVTIINERGDIMIWHPSQRDMFDTDWIILRKDTEQ